MSIPDVDWPHHQYCRGVGMCQRDQRDDGEEGHNEQGYNEGPSCNLALAG